MTDEAFKKAEAAFHDARAKQAAGDKEGAITALETTTRLAPQIAAGWINLGGLYLEQGLADKAASALEKATELAPTQAAAWGNLAAARLLKEDYPGTRTAADRALALAPDHREALRARLAAGRVLKDREALVPLLDAYLEKKPDDAGILGVAAINASELCDWARFDRLVQQLDTAPVGHGALPCEPPMLAVARSKDSAHHLTVAKTWAKAIAAEAGQPLPAIRPRRKDKIRLGYLSSDLRDHAVGHLTLGLFGAHDRKAFEVYVYAAGADDGSLYRKQAKLEADVFRDIEGISARAGAELIQGDEIDILIDLNGHTRGARLDIAALRPAPVQISYLGFPGTTGADFFDFLIGDPIVTPLSDQSFFSEKLINLPGIYQCNGTAPKLPKTARAAHGLPEGSVVFAALLSAQKITRDAFAAWLDVLQASPDSHLWLLEVNPVAKDNLIAASRASGLDPARLIFAPLADKAAHLARLGLADLALDAFPYGGHTSSSDALRAGLPVVTVQGAHFAGRVTQSLLHHLGLDELVAPDVQSFVGCATALAEDERARAKLRQTLADRLPASQLTGPAPTARLLEEVYRKILAKPAV